jgi:hypothetical protein
VTVLRAVKAVCSRIVHSNFEFSANVIKRGCHVRVPVVVNISTIETAKPVLFLTLCLLNGTWLLPFRNNLYLAIERTLARFANH